MIKSKEKVVQIDIYWKCICDRLDWPYPPETFVRRGAQQRIARWWRMVLAKRRLQRLKIGFELEYLPKIGKYYYQAYEDFMGRLNTDNYYLQKQL